MASELLSGSVPSRPISLWPRVLFCIGVWGLINSRNAVRVLMSIELMLNAVNINLMAFSSFVDGDLIRGQVFGVRDHGGCGRGGCRSGDSFVALSQSRHSGYGTFQPSALVGQRPHHAVQRVWVIYRADSPACPA